MIPVRYEMRCRLTEKLEEYCESRGMPMPEPAPKRECDYAVLLITRH